MVNARGFVQRWSAPLVLGGLWFLAAPLAHSAPDSEGQGTEAEVTGHYPAITLLDSSNDVLGRPMSYPDCTPDIQAVKITMAPGQVGEAHQHLTPLFAYVLSGEISVTYDNGAGVDGEGVTRTYKEGEALMEAMHVPHYGFNPTSEPTTLLAVYMKCAP